MFFSVHLSLVNQILMLITTQSVRAFLVNYSLLGQNKKTERIIWGLQDDKQQQQQLLSTFVEKQFFHLCEPRHWDVIFIFDAVHFTWDVRFYLQHEPFAVI